MDNYISNDNNNPINWNGENKKCKEPFCGAYLDMNDYENICNDCFNKEEPTEEEEEKQDFINKINELKKLKERQELEKQFLKFPELEEDEKLKINLKAQREALNKIFDSFSIATIGSFDKDGNLI